MSDSAIPGADDRSGAGGEPHEPGGLRADVAVIGGSGFYRFLEDTTEVEVETPYGPPSDPVVIGRIGGAGAGGDSHDDDHDDDRDRGRTVAFLPRHGRDHRFPPHRIPYRANLWALRSLGVRQVLAPCAVGGLVASLGPGSLVVPDQLVDRTSTRTQTYFDEGAVHLTFADPYCPVGRGVVLRVAGDRGFAPTDGGTMVVIEGPRFSTRAESRWYAEQGWSLVNMTGHPEAVLARELSLCYTAIALVTDLDAGVEAGGAVTQEEVFRVFAENTARLRELLYEVVTALPVDRPCPCPRALDGIELPFALPG